MGRARRNWEGVASDLTTELRHSVLRGKQDETGKVFPDLITELRLPGDRPPILCDALEGRGREERLVYK